MAEMYYFSIMYSDFIYFYRLTSNFCMSNRKVFTGEVWTKFKEVFPKKYIEVYKELNQESGADVENDIKTLITMEHGHFVLTFPLIGIGYDINGYIDENFDKMLQTEQIYNDTLNEIGVSKNYVHTFERRKQKIKKGDTIIR